MPRTSTEVPTSEGSVLPPSTSETSETASKKTHRHWVFTVNNYLRDDEDDRRLLRMLVPADARYIIWGHEVGENGTPHLQGVVSMENPCRMPKLKKLGFARAHLDPVQGPLAKAIEYCKKDGNFEEYGDPPHQGFRNDLVGFKRKIEEGVAPVEVAEEENHFGTYVKYHKGLEKYSHHIRAKKIRIDRSQPKIYIRIGESGSGKTKFCDEQFGRAGWARVPNPTGNWYITESVSYSDTVLFDDIGPQKAPKVEEFLEWTDRYPIEFNSKGGHYWWKPKNIVITSNCNWTNWWPDMLESHRVAFERRIYRIDLVYKDRPEEHFYPNGQDAFQAEEEQ